MTDTPRLVPHPPKPRSRVGDLARAYLALGLGSVAAFFAGSAVERSGVVYPVLDWMLFAVPLFSLVVVLIYRSLDRRIAMVRISGAFLGWCAFVWLFYISHSGEVYYWVITTRDPILFMLALAGGLVAVGLFGADFAWRFLRKTALRT